MMDLFCAIDLRGGRCVRLTQGDFDRATTYDGDPVEVAREFEAAGAPWIHVVDLDAARTGQPVNGAVVAAVAGAVAVPVQAGGGVRSAEAARTLFAAGVERVVVGTAAVERPELVSELTEAGHRVAVGLDVRGTEVAVRGWERGSGMDLFELLDRFSGAGVDAVVVTQIERDGMLLGPDIDGLRAVLAATTVPVVASGGVGSVTDLVGLAGLDVEGRRLSGAIVGKALHDGLFSVTEALAATGAGSGRTGRVAR